MLAESAKTIADISRMEELSSIIDLKLKPIIEDIKTIKFDLEAMKGIVDEINSLDFGNLIPRVSAVINSVEINKFGQLTTNISGSDLQAVLDRGKE